MTAPLWSVTIPVIEPRLICAQAAQDISKDPINKKMVRFK
jgi:hypothetical protein